MSKITGPKLYNSVIAVMTDGYKLGHIDQYVKGTTMVYSNFTPRKNKLFNSTNNFDTMVLFGTKLAIHKLKRMWKDFFESRWDRYNEALIKEYLNMGDLEGESGQAQIDALKKLHALGYLPLEIKALPEGSSVNMGIPVLTVKNTLPEYYWLTNYVETFISAELWPLCNAASVTREYAQTARKYGQMTGADVSWNDFCIHNFSQRGMRGMEDAINTACAHLLYTKGTDTIAARARLEENYYDAVEAYSVNAFEHATATQNIAYYRQQGHGEYAERESLRNILTNMYPKGVVSYVADSEDYYRVISEFAKDLKDVILERDGTLVFRPDSSKKTPYEVILGDAEGETEAERKGTLQILWDIFGGDVNEKGFKVINPKVGVIYGEAINTELQAKIYQGCADSGFCVSNLLVGVGSWGYLCNASRDSFSMAIKGTYSVVNGEGLSMKKRPLGDVSKASAEGLLKVTKGDDGKYVLHQNVSPEEEQEGELEIIFKYGETLIGSWEEVRNRALGGLMYA